MSILELQVRRDLADFADSVEDIAGTGQLLAVSQSATAVREIGPTHGCLT